MKKEAKDISVVNIDGRKLNCAKHKGLIPGDKAVKIRVAGKDKDGKPVWKRTYQCPECYAESR